MREQWKKEERQRERDSIGCLAWKSSVHKSRHSLISAVSSNSTDPYRPIHGKAEREPKGEREGGRE